MHALTRTVRLVINPAEAPPAPAARNTYAGSPIIAGLPRFYEFDVRCRAAADPVTGYVVDIKAVDRAVREAVAPLVEAACRERPETDPASLLGACLAPLRAALPAPLDALRWRVTPYHSYEMEPSRPTTVLLRQRFDFAASHRLHVPSLSEDENRSLFGKCNNPAGHGHNYRVEPCVEIELPPGGRAAFTHADLERLTDEAIISRFDHKHLNRDTPEFADGSGVIPSVEHIAEVFYRLLEGALRRAHASARLRSVTVWETDRTSATYPA